MSNPVGKTNCRGLVCETLVCSKSADVISRKSKADDHGLIHPLPLYITPSKKAPSYHFCTCWCCPGVDREDECETIQIQSKQNISSTTGSTNPTLAHKRNQAKADKLLFSWPQKNATGLPSRRAVTTHAAVPARWTLSTFSYRLLR